MWKKRRQVEHMKKQVLYFCNSMCRQTKVYWSYQRRSSSSVKMIICLIVVILTDRSYYCGKLPDVPCHNNRVCTNNKFHIVSSACSLPPLLTYYLVTAHFQLCGRHSTRSILSSLMTLQITAWSRDFEKVSHHSLPSRVADVHGELHRDRHRRDDQAVSEKEEDVDGHL